MLSFQEIRSIPPELRKITVIIERGENLAAVDRHVFGCSSSDPYYKVRFRTFKWESEVKPKDTNPIWERKQIELGLISEADYDDLTIEVFDHNRIMKHQFLGTIRIPVNALYNAGSGTHNYSFILGPSKEYPSAHVTGKIHFLVVVKD